MHPKLFFRVLFMRTVKPNNNGGIDHAGTKTKHKIYEDLAKKGNYDAIVDLATDAFMKIVSNKPGAIKEKKEFDAFYTDLFAHKPGEQPSQEKKAVLNNILDSFYEKVADTIVEEEKEIRKNEEIIKTGEIQEFSLLKNDPKKVRKLAEAITFSQHPSGLRAQAFFQMVTDLAVTIPDDVGVDDLYSDIGGKTKAKIKEKLKDSYDISDETLYKKTIADDLLKAEFSTVEQYTFSEYPVEAGKNFLIGTNDEHDNIKNLKTQELAKELAKKEKEFEQFKEKNKQLLEIVDDSKKLGEAIGKVGGLNGESAVVKALFDEITNVTEFGTSEFTVETITDFSTGRTDRIHTNAVNPNTYSNAIKMLEKASTNLTNEYFEQDNPEAKAAQEANKIINEFVTEHKAILGNVKKTYGKGMGNPEKQIDLIRCEQENRVLSNDVTKNLGDACRLRDQKINQISLYTDAAQRGLDIISKAAGWLTEDRKTHTRCSSVCLTV